MPLSGEYAPSSSAWAREQADEIESSGGTAGGSLQGLPVIVLTSKGAKTGKLRKTPLMRVEYDGQYAIVGSLGGAAKHPVWVHNVRSESHVELQDGPEKHDYLAHETSGDERELWWKRAVETFPNYATYQKKTTRILPLFVLTRLDG